MNLVSRCSERTSDVLASTASESLGKTINESQQRLSSWKEQHQRTGRPVLDACSSNYPEWNAGKSWSSQEWKSDDMEVRTGDLFMNNHLVCSQSTRTKLLLMTMTWNLTPTQNQTCHYYSDHSCSGWMIECERFKTDVQKMQHKTATNILWYGECLCLLYYKHLYSWWRITQIIYNSIKNTEDLTMKQMFDIFEKLTSE